MILILRLLRRCCSLPHGSYYCYCCYYLHYLVKGSYIVYLPFRFRFRTWTTCDTSHPLEMMLSQKCLRIFAQSVDAWHKAPHSHTSPPDRCRSVSWLRQETAVSTPPVDWATLSSTEYVISAVRMHKFICSWVWCVSATTCVMRTRYNHSEEICCTFAVVRGKRTWKMRSAVEMEFWCICALPLRRHRLVRTNWTVGVKVFIWF